MGYQSNITIGSWTQIDLASVGNQILQIKYSNYIIKRVVVCNPTGTVTGAVGGMYTAIDKGGTVIVPSNQSYTGNITGKTFDLTLAAGINTTVLTGSSIFMTLTTGSSTAARVDLFIIADTID